GGTSDPPVSSTVDEAKHRRVARATKNGNGKAEVAPPVLPGYSIDDVTRLTVERAKRFFESLRLGEERTTIAEPIVREISARLGFMFDVGLGYLTLDRKTGSLSGGEAQRIRLATQVGSGLVGVCCVLDEPTIGPHQRDDTRLIRTRDRPHASAPPETTVAADADCQRASASSTASRSRPGRPRRSTASRRSTTSSRSTSPRSAGRLAPTPRRTPACSTRCGKSSPRPARPRSADTRPAGSAST